MTGRVKLELDLQGALNRYPQGAQATQWSGDVLSEVGQTGRCLMIR